MRDLALLLPVMLVLGLAGLMLAPVAVAFLHRCGSRLGPQRPKPYMPRYWSYRASDPGGSSYDGGSGDSCLAQSTAA